MSTRKRKRATVERKTPAKRAKTEVEFYWIGLPFPRPGVTLHIDHNGTFCWLNNEVVTGARIEKWVDVRGKQVPGPYRVFYPSGRLAMIAWSWDNSGACFRSVYSDSDGPNNLREHHPHCNDGNMHGVRLIDYHGVPDFLLHRSFVPERYFEKHEADVAEALSKWSGCAPPLQRIVVGYLWLDWRALKERKGAATPHTPE